MPSGPMLQPIVAPAPANPAGNNSSKPENTGRTRRTRGGGGSGGGGNSGGGGGNSNKPSYTKKIGTRITQLSTKVTEARCLLTNLETSSLHLGWFCASVLCIVQ